MNRRGFTLVELIITIAILVAMIGILVPSLLGRIEDARSAKDIKFADELTSRVEMALIKEDIYNDIISVAVGRNNSEFNFSCYVDGNISEQTPSNVERFSDCEWRYSDKCRKANGVAYSPNGELRGVTITFSANNNEIEFGTAKINELTNSALAQKGSLSNISSALTKELERAFGRSVKLDSRTYRNSEFTVFIGVGEEASSEERVNSTTRVYGQWNGTNLQRQE